MGNKKQAPKIAKEIFEFFKFWNDPDKEKGKYKSIQHFQVAIYGPSIHFIFKWLVKEEEIKQMSEYTGIPIINGQLNLRVMNEYNIELSKLKIIDNE